MEVAYEFDRFASVAVPIAFGAFALMLCATAASFWLMAWRARVGRSGLGAALALQVGATAALSAVALSALPPEPTVIMSFGTWPANLGYVKSAFYAWMVGPAFLFVPFHFVVVAQRELASGRHAQLRRLLTSDGAGLPPRGAALYPPGWALTAYLAGISVFNYLGVNHLFGSLADAPHKSLFMGFVLARAGLWMGVAVAGLAWYAAALTELKREAVALEVLSRAGGSFPNA